MRQETQHKRRPFGLYIIIGLQVALTVLLALTLLGEKSLAKYLIIVIQNPIFYSWFGWVLFGFMLLAVIGMLLLKRWGWILTMILTGIGLAFSIWSYFQGNPHYVSMLIHVVIVFYLNQRDVQAPFSQVEYSLGAR